MGALGSAAAYHLARRGARVVAFEQYELGHVRGASHDTSRIVRTSYGAPEYVRLAQSAYRDWADLEQESGERLPTHHRAASIFLPTDGPYSASDFTAASTECGVPHELLTPGRGARPLAAVPHPRERRDRLHAPTPASRMRRARWRRCSCAPVRSAPTSATARRSRRRARRRRRRSCTPRTATVRPRKVIVAADAWTNTLLEPLGAAIPLDIMQEQVTYFRPEDPAPLRARALPGVDLGGRASASTASRPSASPRSRPRAMSRRTG